MYAVVFGVFCALVWEARPQKGGDAAQNFPRLLMISAVLFAVSEHIAIVSVTRMRTTEMFVPTCRGPFIVKGVYKPGSCLFT